MTYGRIIILAALLMAGCAETSNAPGPASPEELWQTQNLHSYTMEQVRSCFCIDGGVRMRVTVKADTLFSVMRLSDSTLLSSPSTLGYQTIGALFSLIRGVSPDSVVVEYNTAMGFPSKVDLYPQMHPVDGGVMYETTKIEPLR